MSFKKISGFKSRIKAPKGMLRYFRLLGNPMDKVSKHELSFSVVSSPYRFMWHPLSRPFSLSPLYPVTFQSKTELSLPVSF